jgi:hypothetical protein
MREYKRDSGTMKSQQNDVEIICDHLIEYDPAIFEIVQFGSSVYAPDSAKDLDILVFTFQELSKITGSEKRQASSGHMERFRESGCDFLRFLTRKRKVDSEVVEAAIQECIGA